VPNVHPDVGDLAVGHVLGLAGEHGDGDVKPCTKRKGKGGKARPGVIDRRPAVLRKGTWLSQGEKRRESSFQHLYIALLASFKTQYCYVYKNVFNRI